MTRAPQFAWIATAAFALLIGCAMAQNKTATTPSTPAADVIVSRMTEVQYNNRHAVRPYVVTREYKLFDDKSSQADSQVVAEVSFTPPGNKQYEIKRSQGSGRGEKVVKKVLEHEQQMAGDWEDAALIDRNYKFQLLGEESLQGRRCYILSIEPKRESKDLILGKVWIDAQSYNPLQIIGEPAKNPSWWVKKVEVRLTFSNVEGMWLQTAATANADVRFFGKHVLTARDVSYDTASTEARSRTHQRRRPEDNLGSAVIFAH